MGIPSAGEGVIADDQFYWILVLPGEGGEQRNGRVAYAAGAEWGWDAEWDLCYDAE